MLNVDRSFVSRSTLLFNLEKPWSLNKEDFLILDTKLSMLVISPCEYLTLVGEKALEEVSANNLDYRNIEVDHIGYAC